MSALDPLSLLLGKKKEQAKQVQAPPPPSADALALDDVSAALGRARSRPQATVGVDAAFRLPESPGVFRDSPSRAGGASPSAEAIPAAAAPLSDGPKAPLAASPVSASSGPPKAQSGAPFEDMLPGEKVSFMVSCFLMVTNPLCEVAGRLLVTNYRMKFQTPKGSLREELRWMQEAKVFDVPLGTIEDLKEERSTTVTGVLEIKVKVTTKDFRQLILLMTKEMEAKQIIQHFDANATPGHHSPHRLFAFKYAEEIWALGRKVEDFDGWQLYDPLQEYTRMGIDTDLIPNPKSPWTVTELNAKYELCPTYPSVIVVPRRMTDQDLKAVANFRKKGRLPSMSWCGGPEMEYASLWRCSQTTEGLMGQKCLEDQRLVESIRCGARFHERDLLLIDLRPWKSAWANKAGGGGFEGYARCKLIWGGIDNIHRVREAWRAMGTAVNNVAEGKVGSWMRDVANSSWYDYIGAIMFCTLSVVKEILDSHSSVMVHCSDGWDRTAQATSLAMLCLDPHYRTQAGFLKLIQKEWCSFGHRFRTRLAVGEAPTDEYSPVFIQWLECVFQLCEQFPTAFEFSTSGLLRLATEVLTNRYGTFLCDNEAERMSKVTPHTLSLWSALLHPDEAATWRNPYYAGDKPLLVPSVNQANFVIWEAYWFRYHQRGPRRKAQDQMLRASSPARVVQASPVVPPTAPEAVEASPPVQASPPQDPLPPEPPKRVPAKQVFADDDDEDIFALPKPRQPRPEGSSEAKPPETAAA